MTAAAQRIEQELRQLPVDDLLTLHERLVVSIHEREEAEPLEPGFREQIRRRIEEIDAGKTEGVDAFEALNGM